MSDIDHKQEINVNEYQKLVDETLEDEEKVDKINIEDYLDEETMKLKYKEYIDKLQKNKPNPVESKTVNGKTIYKSETKAGLRKGTKKNNEDVLETAIKEEANKRDDVDKKKLKTKVDEIIHKLEHDADELSKTMDFKVKITEPIIELKERLYSTVFTEAFIDSNGISIDKYLSYLLQRNFNSQQNIVPPDDAAKQLVYIRRLSKQLNYGLLTQMEAQLKFQNIHTKLCEYFKLNEIPDYKIVYIILQETMKKLIISAFTNTEMAFRSNNNWVNDSFKKLILSDVILLQTMPKKLAQSWKVFIKELCKTNNVQIFNDVTNLPSVLDIKEDFVIEETLARTIKCMTPCFIYNYYSAIKSLYLICATLAGYMKQEGVDLKFKNKEQIREDLVNIVKVCNYCYENTRLYEHSVARHMPYYSEEISNELQSYYLNHTLAGPQYYVIKNLERLIVSIFDN